MLNSEAGIESRQLSGLPPPLSPTWLVEPGSDPKLSARKTKVAIITRTKDRPLLLRRAIESVLSQTFTNWTHVIVNDGGDAALCEAVLHGFRNRYGERLILLNHPAPKGMQEASNSAIRATDSEYIAIHDDDDTWDPEFLNQTIGFLEQPANHGCEGVVTHTVQINEGITSGGPTEISRCDYNCDLKNVTLFRMMGGNLFPPISFAYRRRVHDTIGLFNQEYDVLGDWEFNIRFLKQFEIAVLPERLAFYHWRSAEELDDYGNTVTAGVGRHHAIAARIQNSMLRADLSANEIGPGTIAGLASALTKLDERLARLEASTLELNNRKQASPQRLFTFQPRLNGKHGREQSLRELKPFLDQRDRRRFRRVLMRQIAKNKLVSFDIFDTAICRLVAEPKDVFEYAQLAVRELLGNSRFPFADVRINAERIARVELVSKENQDVTIDEIYQVFSRLTRLSVDQILQIKQLELEAELKLCYPSRQALEAYRWCQERNVQTIFMSDTYLNGDFLRMLLKLNRFENPQVYASSDTRKSKHAGSLFTYMAADLKCRRNRTLHIGDNIRADYHKAREKRLNALLFPSSRDVRFSVIDSVPQGSKGRLFAALCHGLAKKHQSERQTESPEDTFWEDLGYQFVGPICCGYLNWLISRAEGRGITDLYFLARDGHLLHEAFKVVRQHRKLDLVGHYIFSSRRLFYIPTVTKLDDHALRLLLTPNSHLTTAGFLARAGLSPDDFRHQIRRAKLSTNEVLTDGHGRFLSGEKRNRLRHLFKRLERDLVELATKERECLLTYLKAVGLIGNESAALVDVGWAGSVLRSLKSIMNITGHRGPNCGYFLGTWTTARPAQLEGCVLESYLVHLGEPCERANVILPGVAVIEAMFNAPHRTIIGLQQRNGTFEPILGRHDSKRDCDIRSLIHRGALQFIRDFTPIAPEAAYKEAYFYIDPLLKRVLLEPTRWEARQLGSLHHYDGFGDGCETRPIARTPNKLLQMVNRKVIRRSFEQCFWRPGFRAQLSTRQSEAL